MLEKQINGFIDYCKVSDFKDKSIKSLSLNLIKFKIFLGKIHVRSINKVLCGSLVLTTSFVVLSIIVLTAL